MRFEARFDQSALQPIDCGRGARKDSSAVRANPVILCVDDEPDMLLILRLFLSAQGFEVIAASHAEEALQLIAEHRPDLIVTDYTMPGMSGLQFCRAVRERSESRDLPIILHSAIDLRDQDHAPFDLFILKPATLELFAKAIRGLLPSVRGRGFTQTGASRRCDSQPA